MLLEAGVNGGPSPAIYHIPTKRFASASHSENRAHRSPLQMELAAVQLHDDRQRVHETSLHHHHLGHEPARCKGPHGQRAGFDHQRVRLVGLHGGQHAPHPARLARHRPRARAVHAPGVLQEEPARLRGSRRRGQRQKRHQSDGGPLQERAVEVLARRARQLTSEAIRHQGLGHALESRHAAKDLERRADDVVIVFVATRDGAQQQHHPAMVQLAPHHLKVMLREAVLRHEHVVHKRLPSAHLKQQFEQLQRQRRVVAVVAQDVYELREGVAGQTVRSGPDRCWGLVGFEGRQLEHARTPYHRWDGIPDSGCPPLPSPSDCSRNRVGDFRRQPLQLSKLFVRPSGLRAREVGFVAGLL
mmetsp:Transcript_30122/g.57850  ORF Transcript_30122/g.57850 Transcript_30122/m.57850 type:complete len:358 (-) Transcript_30122:179-1252(-)